MKTRNVILILILLVVFAWLANKRSPQGSLPPTQADRSTGMPLPTNVAPSQGPASAPNNRQATVAESVSRYIQNVKANPAYDWQQPIDFYGKVVDESNQPVMDATVDYQWNDQSPSGSSKRTVATDSGGSFSIHETGKRVCITVSKLAYYTPKTENVMCYEYANPSDGLFTPDEKNPVVFHLRKKRPGVVLITSKLGMSPDFSFHIPRDGTSIKLDVLHRKTGDSGQIEISQQKPDYASWKQAASWSFMMQIPNGGFVEANDEFPFEAPETGYQPTVQFNFQNGTTNWAQNLTKNYYIEFGNPPQFGYIQIQTGISMGGAIVTYAINPTGSRNLEPAN